MPDGFCHANCISTSDISNSDHLGARDSGCGFKHVLRAPNTQPYPDDLTELESEKHTQTTDGLIQTNELETL